VTYSYEEYENLINDVVTLIEDELRLYARGLVLYGSYKKYIETGTPAFIPGDSDVDLIFLVDTGHPSSPSKPYRRLAKISEILAPVMFDPLYASICDLVLVEYGDLPSSPCDIFNPIHSVEAAKGKVLFGKSNLLGTFDYPDQTLKFTASTQIHNLYEGLRTAFFRKAFIGDEELMYLGADTVLDVVHYLMAYKSHFSLVRLEAVEKFDNEYGDTFGEKMIECVNNSMKIRLGKLDGIRNKKKYTLETLQFCKMANTVCREPF